MSGFCGLIYKHPVPAGSDADFRLRQQLAQLMRGVASRGPHASDSWVSGRVGLGHHLLREVPEAERETQPLRSVDGRFVVVFDGRIDNRDEIFANLDNHLRPRLDCPDVEIVLVAHRCWGEDAPRRLLGDFAYAVWDTVEQSLVAVRDPLAGRPCYYVDREDFFAFASHDEALLGLPGVSWAPNENHIARLFLPTLDDYDQFAPWYADLRTLNPGHRLRIGHNSRLIEFRYRSLPDADPLYFASDQDAIDAFELVLSDAVAARLRCYGPPAMLLSGGIDSASVITAARPLLRNAGRDSIRTYSAMSDDETTCIESQAIRKLIESGPCSPTIVRTPSFEGGMTEEALAKLVWDFADPIDNSLLMHMSLFAKAAEDGCTSVLNGVGGDVTTHTSNFYVSELLRQARYLAAWQEAKATAKHNTYLRHLSARRIFLQSLRTAIPDTVKQPVRLAQSALRKRDATSLAAADAIFSPAFLSSQNVPSRLQKRAPQESRVTMFDPGQSQLKSLDWLAHGQSGYDRVAGRMGVTSRDVWCDLRLVKFYVGLPLSYREGGGWTKSLVRAYLRARGQTDTANRKDKQHVGWKFGDRLMHNEASRAITILTNGDCLEKFFTAGIQLAHGSPAAPPRWQSECSVAPLYDDFTMRSTMRWLQRLQPM